MDTWTIEDWRCAFGERAGIMEVDGEMPREDAEREAWAAMVMAGCPYTWAQVVEEVDDGKQCLLSFAEKKETKKTG